MTVEGFKYATTPLENVYTIILDNVVNVAIYDVNTQRYCIKEDTFKILDNEEVFEFEDLKGIKYIYNIDSVQRVIQHNNLPINPVFPY